MTGEGLDLEALDLTSWQAAAANDENRRAFTGAGGEAVAADWQPIAVPGHWRSTPAFAASDGPLLYRTEFDHRAPADGRRWWLTFDGLFYQGDVWLDGTYLGDTEGYFLPHTFEVTEQLAAQREHLLGVELTCAPQHDR
ncbi:MAG: beta-mannosidase, partial [Acidimicrobiaceae bacterium]